MWLVTHFNSYSDIYFIIYCNEISMTYKVGGLNLLLYKIILYNDDNAYAYEILF